MIKNVQFTSKPVKQAVSAANEALESFKASRQQVNPEIITQPLSKAARQATPMEKSAGMIYAPINVSNKDGINNSLLERVESFAASLGNPTQNIAKNSIDYLA